MVLGDIFKKETIVVNLESTEKDELFEEMVEAIHSVYPGLNREEAVRALNDRELKMTTGIMHGIAVPHAVLPSVEGTIGAIGISQRGIDYDSLDKAPVHIVFMLLAANGQTERHVQILKQLATVLQIPGFTDKMLNCSSQAEVYKVICTSEESLSE